MIFKEIHRLKQIILRLVKEINQMKNILHMHSLTTQIIHHKKLKNSYILKENQIQFKIKNILFCKMKQKQVENHIKVKEMMIS